MSNYDTLSNEELAVLVDSLREKKESLLSELMGAVTELDIRTELDKLNKSLSPVQIEALKRLQVVKPEGIVTDEKVGS